MRAVFWMSGMAALVISFILVAASLMINFGLLITMFEWVRMPSYTAPQEIYSAWVLLAGSVILALYGRFQTENGLPIYD